MRRAKALAPSGCEARPANCRSSRKPSERVMEVTTGTEALRRDGPPYGRLSEHTGRNARERRAGLEKDDAEADPPLFRGRQPASGKRATRAPGVSAGVLAAACVPEGDGGNTGSPVGGVHAPTGLPRGTGRAGQGGGEARSTGEAGSCRWREGASVRERCRQEDRTDGDWREPISSGKFGDSRAHHLRKRRKTRTTARSSGRESWHAPLTHLRTSGSASGCVGSTRRSRATPCGTRARG